MTDQDSTCKNPSTPLPWHKDGLNFQCTECGKCCTGAPGYVWVTESEIASMAELLEISVELFKRKYTRQCDNRYALLEKRSHNYDCIFLKDNKCKVYQTRPSQCRTFPWWEENLKSERNWKAAAQSCEGINDKAPVVPNSTIAQQLEERKRE